MPDILDIAQLAVQAAMRNGAEFADASVGSGISVGVDLENSSLKECEVVRDYGIGVRAFYRGGMGTATTTSLSEEAARTVGRQAAEMRHGLRQVGRDEHLGPVESRTARCFARSCQWSLGLASRLFGCFLPCWSCPRPTTTPTEGREGRHADSSAWMRRVWLQLWL